MISPPHFTFIWTEEEQWDRGPVVGTLTWRGEVFNIHSGVTLLGKIPHAGGGQYIKLDHKSISDKHATITYENGTDVMDRQPFLTSYILIFSFPWIFCTILGTFKLADIFSTNGTYVPDSDGEGNTTFRKLGNDFWIIPDNCEIRFGVIKTYFQRTGGMKRETTETEVEQEQEKKFEESTSKIETQKIQLLK